MILQTLTMAALLIVKIPHGPDQGFETRKNNSLISQGLVPEIVVLTDQFNNLNVGALQLRGIRVLGERTFWPFQFMVPQVALSPGERPSSEAYEGL